MCANRSSGMNRYQALDHAADAFERTWHRVVGVVQRTWAMFGMDDKLEAGRQYAIQHPVVTLCAVLTVCMCSIPIMCFLFFVMGSLFLTFLGFMFVEGFLLTFASVFLGGALFIVGLLSIGASSVLALTWCLLSSGTSCFTSLKHRLLRLRQQPPNIAALFSFLHYQRTNGECVRDTEHVPKEE